MQLKMILPFVCLGFFFAPTGLFANQDALLETHASLQKTPAGAIELAQGEYHSVMLDRSVPYRVFGPTKPEWDDSELDPTFKPDQPKSGMPLVVYVLNLKMSAPRPSSATDRAIIEDLIRRQFFVVAVDFTGGEVKDHLEWNKDISGLMHVFGGSYHTEQKWYLEKRKQLLIVPGPNAGKEYAAFEYPNQKRVPINSARLYIAPSGYTVDVHQVFHKNLGVEFRDELFYDIIYPMPSEKNEKLPLLLEISSTGKGTTVVNANTFVLYSWLFNGYAFASTCHVRLHKENPTIYPFVRTIRYLHSKKEKYSLNGVIGTAGISKSARRTFSESNFKPRETEIDSEPYGKESNKVSITMPAVPAALRLDERQWENYPSWEHLHEDTPAIVLTWNHQNRDGDDDGSIYREVRDAYVRQGMGNKFFYKEVPQAGHEYDVYHLNEIMAFWDRFCK
ncbi:MAG: hypothetical protein HUJ26_20600 [Planctomycetaceae bacterium]|nr:hypothetical protein [Planctomycetaceae bacterium]